MNRSFGEWSNDVANIPNSLSERDCNGQRLPNVNEVNGKEGVRKYLRMFSREDVVDSSE